MPGRTLACRAARSTLNILLACQGSAEATKEALRSVCEAVASFAVGVAKATEQSRGVPTARAALRAGKEPVKKKAPGSEGTVKQETHQHVKSKPDGRVGAAGDTSAVAAATIKKGPLVIAGKRKLAAKSKDSKDLERATRGSAVQAARAKRRYGTRSTTAANDTTDTLAVKRSKVRPRT